MYTKDIRRSSEGMKVQQHMLGGMLQTEVFQALGTCSKTKVYLTIQKDVQEQKSVDNKYGAENWSFYFEEFDAFGELLYARRAYSATNLKLHHMWSDIWGLPVVSQTMEINRFKNILRYLRFDMKKNCSGRLKTDKFALCYKRSSKTASFVTSQGKMLQSMSSCFLARHAAILHSLWQVSPINLELNSGCLLMWCVNIYPYLRRNKLRLRGESDPKNLVID
ncbi:hypothetical protein ILUMI_06159 [Ignelater luminosus]|uniref:Uncharacterized protein n=1 Tax=Ignelater luminosus TaxID=2038154 RepID=A0A8K0GJD7_IGNLU|nr:hypothetical protein ILUMI_06159 [Ignelater luminosus]